MPVDGEGHASRQGTALCGDTGVWGCPRRPPALLSLLPLARETLSGSTGEEGAGRSVPCLSGQSSDGRDIPVPPVSPSVPGRSALGARAKIGSSQPPQPALPARGSLPTEGRPGSRARPRIPTARLWIWGSLRPLLFSPSLLLPLPFYFPAPRAWIKVTDNFPLAPY